MQSLISRKHTIVLDVLGKQHISIQDGQRIISDMTYSFKKGDFRASIHPSGLPDKDKVDFKCAHICTTRTPGSPECRTGWLVRKICTMVKPLSR